uniref:Ankyrin repeat and SOCS box containing 4 n=1 Tax=Neogobius melanostomus TaxID=47308 RepID=A0A8C6S3P8_9GOBI
SYGLPFPQLKRRFLEALQADDTGQVRQILDTGRLDIDTVLEVDDPSMLLASYKQGYWLPGHKLEKSWAMALHVCVMYNSLECAVLLIQEGAALNKMPNGKTPLHVACEVSNPECAALLLEHGARVNSWSLSGHTPLHYCITPSLWPALACSSSKVSAKHYNRLMTNRKQKEIHCNNTRFPIFESPQ